MKIHLVINPSEVSSFNGLFEYINLVCGSLKNKGYRTDILLYDQNQDYTGAVTLGGLNVKNQGANIPLTDDITQVSQNLFDIIKNCLFENGKQHTVKLFGEIKDMEEILNSIESNYNNAAIFCYRQGQISTIKILSTDDRAVSDVYSAFNKNIYAGEDVTLAQRLLELLSVRGKTISVAESLTGGLICSEIISNSGASQFFDEGLITYSNSSKIKRLNIDGEIIKNYGAVSYETAYEMAAGLLAEGNCGVSVATTGIAGPTGGTITKPVGLTYIAIGTPQKVHVFRHVFGGKREDVRKAASYGAMFYAIKVLKDNSLEYEQIKIN